MLGRSPPGVLVPRVIRQPTPAMLRSEWLPNGGGGVIRAPAMPVMRPAACHVMAPSYLLEEVRHVILVGWEAPPPGSVLGLGGLARMRPVCRP